MEAIKNEKGEWEWVYGQNKVANVVVNYFKEIFSSSTPTYLDYILSQMGHSVIDQMYEHLQKPFVEEEILSAIHQISATKILGSNGMPGLFYQKFQHIIHANILITILDILNNNINPSYLSHAYICLIPKIKKLDTPKDYIPISLCNLIIKTFTKTLANKLKTVLPDIIHSIQIAFVLEKLITDNALVIFENFHYIKNRSKWRNKYFTLKLDLSKAYDRVESLFLDKIMRKLRFLIQWVPLIMRTISTVSYSLLINNEPTEHILLSSGLQQGE